MVAEREYGKHMKLFLSSASHVIGDPASRPCPGVEFCKILPLAMKYEDDYGRRAAPFGLPHDMKFLFMVLSCSKYVRPYTVVIFEASD